MLARIAILFSLSLVPLVGQAQAWLPRLQPDSPATATPLIDELLALDEPPAQGLYFDGAPVVPVWASADGRWLALVALSQEFHGPLLPLAPAFEGMADWRVLDAATSVSGGLRLRAGHGFYVDALLGQYRSAASIECPSAPCQFDAVPAWSSSAVNGSLGFGWLSSGGGMDLSYGLSWLQAQPAHPMSHDAASAGFLGGLPMLAVPGLFPYRLDSSTALVANGRWTWSPDAPVIRFGATFGHGRAWSSQPTGILLQPIDLDQASLTLGIGGNTLEGVIVGRMLSSDDPAFAARRWSALDLGVSWRTPWQGELSVGAQNVWSSADAAPADKVDPAQARMPYIRYRQDL